MKIYKPPTNITDLNFKQSMFLAGSIENGKAKDWQKEVENCIRMFSSQKQCKIQELNIQEDHVHVIIDVPPKISI